MHGYRRIQHCMCMYLIVCSCIWMYCMYCMYCMYMYVCVCIVCIACIDCIACMRVYCMYMYVWYVWYVWYVCVCMCMYWNCPIFTYIHIHAIHTHTDICIWGIHMHIICTVHMCMYVTPEYIQYIHAHFNTYTYALACSLMQETGKTRMGLKTSDDGPGWLTTPPFRLRYQPNTAHFASACPSGAAECLLAEPPGARAPKPVRRREVKFFTTVSVH